MAPLLKSRRTRAVAVAVVFLSVALWRLALYPQAPRLLEFGKGSGWHGLDTIKVLQDGTVTLHRKRRGFWETTSLKLSPESLARVLDAVEKNRLLELDRAHHGGVMDGTQWVFWFTQGDREKAVYFDNRFPDEIVRFADALDAILAENGLGEARWRPVADFGARKHERELWDSIKR